MRSDVLGDLSTTALELMYSGHEALAWKFIDAGFPESQEKEWFVGGLRSRLEESAYWHDLKLQNSTNTPPATNAQSGPTIGVQNSARLKSETPLDKSECREQR